ncbi:unnamed protein product, partial [marine sediment metagenome]
RIYKYFPKQFYKIINKKKWKAGRESGNGASSFHVLNVNNT